MQRGNIPILIILIVAAFAVFAIHSKYLETKQLMNLYQPVNQALNKPLPASNSGEMTNWKTYTNNKHSYTFKYPSSYKVVTEDNEVKIDNGKAFFLKIRIHPNGSSEYLQRVWKERNCVTCDYDVAPPPYTDQVQREINGNKFYFNTDGSNTRHAFVVNFTQTRTIELSTYGPNYLEGFNQILSTFKFTQ